MFGTIKTKLKEFGEKISDDAAKLGNLKLPIDPNDIVDPGHEFGPLWEMNDQVDNCRECGIKFQHLIKRKHHCRSCAGIFCDTCCPVYENRDGEEKRLCVGCFRGEVPSEDIKQIIKSQLEAENPTGDNVSFVDKVMDKAASKVTETLRALPKSPMNSSGSNVFVMKLLRGSAYPDDKRQSTSKSLPSSGYFELMNKSDTFCGIKVLKKGNSNKFEIPRPSYFAVPPKAFIHGFFDPNDEEYDLFLLYDNKYDADPTLYSQALVFDTRAAGVTKDSIARCARIEEFRKAVIYSFRCRNRNVLLKYKGDSIVEPRNGDSVSRVGLMGRLQSRRFADSKIDYSTNIEDITLAMSITT